MGLDTYANTSANSVVDLVGHLDLQAIPNTNRTIH